ncbi:23S rRNA (pseudouridine(1915)-N(3))-methyltransferase RlmH [Coprothermobacter platensis]|uniref:23S rRNA (pseudouridine(1915)-N(3))-methyltransferase RlmH n=1 Tax=Coprothermobacter platensis TaxID=108819 RepID=UPI00036F7D0B|nr:23S rRNA (pseudouridine(1915)-N(3))-methyltransferase RlmH [Coprothermobacter platensis]
MKINLIAVGKLKKDYVSEGMYDYMERIKHYIPFHLIETSSENPIQYLQKKGMHIALDINGKEMSSEAFATFINNLMNTSTDDVYFYIGGANGFNSAFMKQVNERISLSQMTFPHELARLLFLEQLYRALTIIRGEHYHK